MPRQLYSFTHTHINTHTKTRSVAHFTHGLGLARPWKREKVAALGHWWLCVCVCVCGHTHTHTCRFQECTQTVINTGSHTHKWGLCENHIVSRGRGAGEENNIQGSSLLLFTHSHHFPPSCKTHLFFSTLIFHFSTSLHRPPFSLLTREIKGRHCLIQPSPDSSGTEQQWLKPPEENRHLKSS